MARNTITRSAWRRTPKDYRMGDPRKGTAKVLRLTEFGTSLVPVTVVEDEKPAASQDSQDTAPPQRR